MLEVSSLANHYLPISLSEMERPIKKQLNFPPLFILKKFTCIGRYTDFLQQQERSFLRLAISTARTTISTIPPTLPPAYRPTRLTSNLHDGQQPWPRGPPTFSQNLHRGIKQSGSGHIRPRVALSSYTFAHVQLTQLWLESRYDSSLETRVPSHDVHPNVEHDFVVHSSCPLQQVLQKEDTPFHSRLVTARANIPVVAAIFS